MRKNVFFIVMVSLFLGACTSTETVGEVEGTYYYEKIQELAASYGGYVERESSAPPMTKAEYEELERIVLGLTGHGQESD